MTVRMADPPARSIAATRAVVPAPRRLPSAVRGGASARWFRPVVRSGAGVAVLAVVVAHVGAAPFLRGLAGLDVRVLAVAVALSAIATGAASWRWRVIAARLGVPLTWPAAVGRYYRSQFLNTVLPGGVLGDVHRAVDHGRTAVPAARGTAAPGVGARGAAARAVALERVVGQAVQLLLAVVVLLAAGARFAGALLPVAGLVAGVTAALGVAAGAGAFASERIRRILRREAAALRVGLGSAAVCAQAAAASLVVCACHLATFAVAAAAVGASVPPVGMLTLGLLVLLAASVPVNVGGWGPREGAAAWAFAAAGLGAGSGVAAATLFGVLALVSVAPGALLASLAPVIRRQRTGRRAES